MQTISVIYLIHVLWIFGINIVLYKTFTNNMLAEILSEEHNTSLMYHKLFPNHRLLRDLQAKGYSFEMGSGLKLQRQYYASQHRNSSGPKRQRMLQTIVVFKDGKFFRKIPKASWVQLVDPSDQKSVTFGELFMKKLLDTEMQQYNQAEQKLLSKYK